MCSLHLIDEMPCFRASAFDGNDRSALACPMQ